MYSSKVTRKTFLIILPVILLPVLIYARTASYGFLSWDDNLLIGENYSVLNFSPSVFWTYDPELYIPMTLLSFQINYAFSGANPFWFHITNVVLHAGNALLVYILITLILKNKFTAFFTALIFAAHPINTEAVAWVSARKELLSAFFFLGSFICYVKAGNGIRKIYSLSVIFFILAMMSKVTAIVLPAVLAVHDYTNGNFNANSKAKIISFMRRIALFLIPAVIFAVIAFVGKSQAVAELTIIQVLLLAARSASFDLQKFFVPLNFSAIYPAPDPISIGNPAIVFSIITITTLSLLAFVFRKNRFAILGACWFVITLSPSFLAYMRSNGISMAADRYAYMPSIGLTLFFVVIASAILKNRKYSSAFIGAIVILLSFAAFSRSKVWANSEALFTDVLQKNPSSYVAYNNIGNEYLRKGDLDDARILFEKAISLKPDFADALNSLGAVYGKAGKYDMAEEYILKAIESNPNLADAHFNLGGVYFMRNEFEKAIGKYKAALKINPHHEHALRQLKIANEKLVQ